MKKYLIVLGALLLAGCSPSDPDQSKAASEKAAAEPRLAKPIGPITPAVTEAPSGAYKLDKAHASLDFRVNHIGFSNYTARLTDFDADLKFDPKNPSASSVSATVNPASLSLPTPPKGFLEELLGAAWLDTGKHNQIKFQSSKIVLSGPDTATITGDLTLHGVTLPVTLEAKFNGGWAGHQFEPKARIGFSAKGSFNRSAFGIANGIPAPGKTMGVSDNVDVIIEAEFSGPPLEAAAAQPQKSQ